jgi:hypothetical protein
MSDYQTHVVSSSEISCGKHASGEYGAIFQHDRDSGLVATDPPDELAYVVRSLALAANIFSTGP